MTRRPSDAWIGAAVLLGCFSLLCYLSHILIAALLVIHFSLIGVAGLALLHLWLKPDRELQRLACILLTLPVLAFCGIPGAIAVFLTMWYTHVGHVKQSGAASDA